MIRAALYWAPDLADPLSAAGNAWLGRDPETGAVLRQPRIPGIAALTAAPGVYGFHATLRPPMQLATGWDAFAAAAMAVASRCTPFPLPPLQVAAIGDFLALRLSAPCPGLHALANACVAGTEPCRLAPDAPELARRRAAGLTPAEDAMLLRWGYPYVMETWSFHMTLSGRLSAADMTMLLPAAQAYFAPVLGLARRVTDICIFTQRAEAALLVAQRLKLGREQTQPTYIETEELPHMP